MSTMDYVDFHSSFSVCSEELYRFFCMRTLVKVLGVLLKTYMGFCLHQLWIIKTSIAVLGVVVRNYIDFCLYGLSVQY